MPVKASYLLLTTAGAIVVWSGIKGVGISSALRDVLSGKNPASATPANQIQATVYPATNSGGIYPTPSGKVPGLVAPVSAGEKAWAVALLASVGAPPTNPNINSITSWITQETQWTATPPDGALYTNNPLNTTQPGFGAVGSVNSVGVKIYPTILQGLAATVRALTNGDYGDILAALRSGRGLVGTFHGLSIWSGGGYDSVGYG